jgi:HK97 family phage prohead protease
MPTTKSPAAIRAEMRGVPEQRISSRSEFELREVPDGTGGSSLKFTGFACVTDVEYEMEDAFGPFVETVSKGAFSKTLTERADVAFLLNHSGLVLARSRSGTLKLSEVTDGTKSPVYGVTGLYAEAQLDPQNHYVQAMRSAVERGDLDECSFAFKVTRQTWSKDWGHRRLAEVDLNHGDVSLVTFAANPHTGGTVSLRQRRPGDRYLQLTDTDRDYLAAQARLSELDHAAATSIAIARAHVMLAQVSKGKPR